MVLIISQGNSNNKEFVVKVENKDEIKLEIRNLPEEERFLRNTLTKMVKKSVMIVEIYLM